MLHRCVKMLESGANALHGRTGAPAANKPLYVPLRSMHLSLSHGAVSSLRIRDIGVPARQIVRANSLIDNVGSAVQKGFSWLSWSDSDLRHRPPSALDMPAGVDRLEGSSSYSTTSSSSSVETAQVQETAEEILQQKYAVVRSAYQNGKLGFGFSAGGLMFPYYVGFISGLTAAHVLRSPAMMAGASAGSLIAAAYNAGLDMPTVEQSMVNFGKDCLENGTRFRLGPLLKDFLEEYLPPNAHELCEGCTHVAVTRVLPYFRPKLISKWESREDLIHCLLTSCHIPWYLDGRWVTNFRGHWCVDGGVTNFVPKVPDAEYTVRVMCFPTWHLEAMKSAAGNSKPLKRFRQMLEIDVSLDTYEEWPYDAAQVLKWALLASPEETSNLLIDKGKRDAAAWVAATGLDVIVQQQLAAEQQHPQQQEAGRQVEVGVSGAGAGPAAAEPQEEGEMRDKWLDTRDRHEEAVRTLEMVKEGKRGREEEHEQHEQHGRHAAAAAGEATGAGAGASDSPTSAATASSVSSSSEAVEFAEGATSAAATGQQPGGSDPEEHQAKRLKAAAAEAAAAEGSGAAAGTAVEAESTATANTAAGGRS